MCNITGMPGKRDYRRKLAPTLTLPRSRIPANKSAGALTGGGQCSSHAAESITRHYSALLLAICVMGCFHQRPQTIVGPQQREPATMSSRPSTTATSTRPTSAPTTSASSQPAGPAGVVLREGAYITDRIGRLIHGSDGQAELAFESAGAVPGDSPMLVLPNLYLQQMEDQVARHSRDLRFKVSGMITEYKNHDYLLLQEVEVLEPPPASHPATAATPDSGQRP